ncbi:MAG: glyoxalase [Pseudomonadota bacterium]
MAKLPQKGVGRPSGAEYGRGLRTGLGVNVLTRDVPAQAAFLADVFEIEFLYFDDDFALARTPDGAEFMLHHDRTYRGNALLGVVLGSDEGGGVRGAGVELRLYGVDPDASVARAEAIDAVVLAPPEDKPHGLREAVIVDPEGYVWIPSRPLPD